MDEWLKRTIRKFCLLLYIPFLVMTKQIDLKRQFVEADSIATFSCETQGMPVNWIFEKTQGYANISLTSFGKINKFFDTKFQLKNTNRYSHLTVKSVSPTDTGKYQCVGLNGNVVKTVYLQINEFPRSVNIIKVEGSIIDGNENKELDLACEVSGGVPTETFIWWNKTHKLTETKIDWPWANLSLHVTRESNGLELFCIVGIAISPYKLQDKIVLNIYYKPRVTVTNHFQNNIHVTCGQYVNFTCFCDGNPLPTLTWKKDGNILSHNPVYEIFQAQKNDSGVYSCTGQNQQGEDTKDVILYVNCPLDSTGTYNISTEKYVSSKKGIQPILLYILICSCISLLCLLATCFHQRVLNLLKCLRP